MNNQNNSNSKAPLIIIGVVLVVVLGALWWFLNRPKTPVSNTNRATANRVNNPTPNVANAPIGAQPPNYLGSPTATVTVEEFADFQCGACAAVHPRMKEITSTYGSRIKFVFRHFPLAIPAHDKAYEAATAAEAAGLQGKFWDMQNLLFTNQQAWTANPDYRRIWEDYAQKIGLDVERFKDDMAGMSAKSRVSADMERGRALGVTSTPSIYINGMSIPYEQMSPETLRQIIDAELQKAPAGNQRSAPTSTAPSSGANAKPVNAPANANTKK